MIKSMTAFARHETSGEWGSLVWEIRAVNHRYLETFVRMPDDLRGLEQTVRNRVGKQLGRGKVECALRYQPASGPRGDLQIDDALAQQVIDASDRIGQMMGGSPSPTPLDILRWPGVVQEPESDLDSVRQAAADGLTKALDELIDTRRREGERIEAMLEQRLDGIESIVAAVRDRRPQVLDAIRDKLRQRVADLDVTVNEDRLEQELVMIAQKLDVDEELDRLEAHVAETRDVLKRKEPVGRRLDFLMQEFNREANTLGSKSNDADTTQHAVDLKVLIEQMREQVQNVE
ncbi:MAG: YicC/YloC family endoribonuclease [Pseudomonadota bacterium]